MAHTDDALIGCTDGQIEWCDAVWRNTSKQVVIYVLAAAVFLLIGLVQLDIDSL